PQKRSRFIDEIAEEYIEFKTTYNSNFKVKARIPKRTSRFEEHHSQKMPKYEDYSQEEKVLTIGTRVAHDVFGNGKIVQLSGFGENLKATVDFDEGFSKNLMLKYAKLKIL
ncbi:MAG: hypothetical protein N3A61_06140, partial [Ignavibacteria bacterium]|nr:hypothetical protein [Ignavibacteria bacterium]